MNKKQYRAIVRAQKRQNKPCGKLIHLLINYRSHIDWNELYPYGLLDTMRKVKRGEWVFDGMALSVVLHEFNGREHGYFLRQPSFKTHYLGESKRRGSRANDDFSPF